VFGLWITTMLMVFGSQSMQFQEVVVNLFNPALVTAVAFVGLGVLRRSFFGIPIGAVIVLVAVVLGGAVVRHYTQQYEKSLAQDKSAVATAGNQQQGITGLTPEQYEALFELPRAQAAAPVHSNMIRQTTIILDDSGDDDFDAESYMQDDDQELMNNGVIRMQSIGIVDRTAETMTRADDFDESSEGTIDDNAQLALDEKAVIVSLDVVSRNRKSSSEEDTSASDKELDFSDSSSSEESVDHDSAVHAHTAEQDISQDDNDFDGSSTEESMNNQINVDKDDFDYDDEEC
jgi:lipopolysaccharide export LptBFGC system permease protein LptF